MKSTITTGQSTTTITTDQSTTSDVWEYAEKWRQTASDPVIHYNPCPNCGYCPYCGRSGHQAYPYYPVYPGYPWQPNITWCYSQVNNE